MEHFTKEILALFVKSTKTLTSSSEFFTNTVKKMNINKEKRAQDEDQDEDISKDIILPQIIITSRGVSFKRSSKEVEHVVRICHTSPPKGEREDYQRLPLVSEQTKQSLRRGSFSSECIRSISAETRQNMCFNVHWEKKIGLEISKDQFQLVDLNENDTRLVNGLRTTTLCSTEL